MSSKEFVHIIILLILSLLIVNVSIIPSGIKRFADSIPGRIVLFVAILTSYQTLGWIPTILMTLLALLLLAGRTTEGFADLRERFSTDIDIIEPGHLWWDEKLLGREMIVKNRRVDTEAIDN